MPIKLDIKPSLDEAAARREAGKAEKVFANASKGIGQSFGKQFSGGLSSASSDVQKLAREYQRMYDKASDAAGKLRVEEQKLAEIREKGVSGSKLVAQVERQQAAARNEARAVREITAAYRELQSVQRGATLTRSLSRGGSNLLSGFTSQTNGVVSHFQGIGRSAGGAFIAGAAAAMIGGGLVNAATSAARTAVDAMQKVFDNGIEFERTFNKLKGVTRANAAEMAQMRGLAKALGADLTLPGVSSKGALDAMLELSKGGLSLQDVTKSARGTLLLSTAAGISPSEAAASQASVLQSFNLDASKADHIADLLTAAQQVAPGEIPDFMLALQQAGTVAHGFGISVEDTMATLAMMFKAGVVGSDAGTSMKTMLTHLARPSDEAAGAMDELGLQIHDINGRFIGMRALIQQINDAGKRMRPDDFQRDVTAVFGTDAIRPAMISSDVGPQTYDAALREFQHGGQAQEMGAAMMSGWPGVVEKIQNSIDAIKLSMFDLFQTAGAQQFGDQIVAQLSKIGDWIDTHKSDIVQYFGNFVSGALQAGQGLAIFASFGIKTIAAFQQVTGRALGSVIALMSNFGTFAGGIIKHIPGLNNLGNALENGGRKGREIADAIYSSGDALTKMGDKIYSVGQTLGRWSNTVDGFTESAANALRITDAVGQQVTALPDGTLTIHDNTPEVEQRVKNLGFEIKQLPDGEFEIIPKTEGAKRLYQAFVSEMSQTPITPQVIPDTRIAESRISDLGKIYQNMLTPPAAQPAGPPGPQAHNFYKDWYPVTTPAPAAPPSVPALPSLPPITAPRVRGSSGTSGGGGSGGSGGSEGAFYFPPNASGVDAAIAFARAQQGKPYGFGSAGPTMYDCSGIISDIYAVLTGKPYTGSERYFTTEANFPALGFERGFVPGAFNIGVSHGGPGGGHMAGTLPNGVNIESGGTGKGVRYGRGAAGAKDFAEQWHLITPDMMTRGRGGTPVTVTNFGSEARNDLSSIGTSLASDMGISEGIPGIVKFITGALANMAFAPVMGALGAVRQAGTQAAAAGGIQMGGSGLLGYFGSMAGASSGGGGFGGYGPSPAGFGGGIDIHAPNAAGPAGASPGVSGLGLGGAGGSVGYGAPGGQSGYGAAGAVGVGASEIGNAFGPSALTTPKAVGRQMGQDAPQSGGVTGFTGGLIGGAMNLAAQGAGMGVNAMAPGAGAAASMAAQIGQQLIDRTAGYVTQLAGIGAQGALETLMLSDTALADPTNTVLGRIAIAAGGARPQIPNVAGMMAGGGNVAGGTQSGPAQGLGQGAQGDPNDPNAKNADGQRPWLNIEHFHNTSGNPSDGKAAGRDLVWQGYQAAGVSRK